MIGRGEVGLLFYTVLLVVIAISFDERYRTEISTTPSVPARITPHLCYVPRLSDPRLFTRVDKVTGDVVIHSASGKPLSTMTREAQEKLVSSGQRLDIDSFNVDSLVKRSNQ